MADELMSIAYMLLAVGIILFIGQIIYQIEVRKGKKDDRRNKADRKKQR